MDVFVTSEPPTAVTPETHIDILDDIVDARGMTERFLNLTLETVAKYGTLLINQSMLYIKDMEDTLKNLLATLDDFVVRLNHPLDSIQDIGEFIDMSEIFTNGFRSLQRDTKNFILSLKEDSRLAKNGFETLFEDEVKQIKVRLQEARDNFVNQSLSLINHINGFGIGAHGSLRIFNLEIIGLRLEMVYSAERLGACGKFARAYEVLKGEKAFRIYAEVSSDVIRLLPFIRLLKGAGIGLAVSLETMGRLAAQVHANIRLLGTSADVDIILSNTGIYIYMEHNIWDTFKTKLEVYAEHGSSWKDLIFDVKGQFLADKDGDGDFGDSYLSALRGFTQKLADDAEKRISGVEGSFTEAQNCLTAAQNWLEEKKSVVYSANKAFDAAVSKLEDAKSALERAKIPFQKAIDKLNEAQRKVDNLCRIKTCDRICVPGLKCSICWTKVWFVKIPYPCCSFTTCMFSFPDPICVAINLGCYALRGIAYAALEAAKLFVKAPMVVLDAAKLAVTGAQFIVDKSRVVLDIAVAAMDLAQVGLEGSKTVLEGAKYALEGVKKVVKWGLKALDYVIQYGIQAILDVRNCGFELKLTTGDESVFDIHCEVNVLKQGFRDVRMRINFNNVFQSLWQAAKATVETVLKSIFSIIGGRKRREALHSSMFGLHRVMREVSRTDIDNPNFDYVANQTIDVVFNTLGFRNGVNTSDYDNRKDIFEEKCNQFNLVHGFLRNASEILFSMSNNTSYVLRNATDSVTGFSSFNIGDLAANVSTETLGIDLDSALYEFNMTEDDILATLDEAKQTCQITHCC